MSTTTIRKRSGEVFEIEHEEPLTLVEIAEAIGEDKPDTLLETLVGLAQTIKEQGGAKPPVVNVAAPEVRVAPTPVNVAAPSVTVNAPKSGETPPAAKDWRAADITVLSYDPKGRVKTMRVEKIY